MALHVASTTESPESIQRFYEGREVTLQDDSGNAVEPAPLAEQPSDATSPAAAPLHEDEPNAEGADETAVDPEATEAPSHGTEPHQFKKRTAKGRIQQEIERRKAAETEAAELRGRTKALEELVAKGVIRPQDQTAPPQTGQQPQAEGQTQPEISAKPIAPKAPRLKDFDYDLEKYDQAMADHDEKLTAFNEKLAEYIADQKAGKIISEREQQDQQNQALNAIRAKNDEGRKVYGAEAWTQAMQNAPDVTFPPETASMIHNSPVYEHVVFHLSSNPEDAQFLASLPPAQAGYEMAQLEAFLKAEVIPTLGRSPQAQTQNPPAQQAAPARVLPKPRTAPLTPVSAGSASTGAENELQRLADSNQSKAYRQFRVRQKAGA